MVTTSRQISMFHHEIKPIDQKTCWNIKPSWKICQDVTTRETINIFKVIIYKLSQMWSLKSYLIANVELAAPRSRPTWGQIGQNYRGQHTAPARLYYDYAQYFPSGLGDHHLKEKRHYYIQNSLERISTTLIVSHFLIIRVIKKRDWLHWLGYNESYRAL